MTSDVASTTMDQKANAIASAKMVADPWLMGPTKDDLIQAGIDNWFELVTDEQLRDTYRVEARCASWFGMADHLKGQYYNQLQPPCQIARQMDLIWSDRKYRDMKAADFEAEWRVELAQKMNSTTFMQRHSLGANRVSRWFSHWLNVDLGGTPAHRRPVRVLAADLEWSLRTAIDGAQTPDDAVHAHVDVMEAVVRYFRDHYFQRHSSGSTIRIAFRLPHQSDPLAAWTSFVAAVGKICPEIHTHRERCLGCLFPISYPVSGLHGKECSLACSQLVRSFSRHHLKDRPSCMYCGSTDMSHWTYACDHARTHTFCSRDCAKKSGWEDVVPLGDYWVLTFCIGFVIVFLLAMVVVAYTGKRASAPAAVAESPCLLRKDQCLMWIYDPRQPLPPHMCTHWKPEASVVPCKTPPDPTQCRDQCMQTFETHAQEWTTSIKQIHADLRPLICDTRCLTHQNETQLFYAWTNQTTHLITQKGKNEPFFQPWVYETARAWTIALHCFWTPLTCPLTGPLGPRGSPGPSGSPGPTSTLHGPAHH